MDTNQYTRRKFLKRSMKMTAAGIFIPTIIEGLSPFKIAYAATGTALITNDSGLMQRLFNKIAVSRTFTLPRTFSILRVGIRCCISDFTTTITNPSFYVGAQSGNTTQPFDATWVNSMIIDQIAGGNWGTVGSGSTLSFGPRFLHATTLVGSTFTDSSTFASSMTLPAKSNTGAPAMFFTELDVGSPNWGAKMFAPVAAGTPAASTRSDFLAQMVATTPSFTGYGFFSPALTLAFSQAAGTIDTACYGWLSSQGTLEVADLAVSYAP